MKRSDAYREYARIIDMVSGHPIHVNHCMRNRYSKAKYILNDEAMYFVDNDNTEFAVAIVEGRPVFPGDILYDENGAMFKMDACISI